MIRSLAFRIAVLVMALPWVVSATLLTNAPSPLNIEDLDHDALWTWRLDNVNLGGQRILSATLTIAGIYNWQDEQNRLFIHLLDTVPNAGTTRTPEVAGGIQDYFLNPADGFAPAYGSSNIVLDAPTFLGGEVNKVDYTYIFTPEQLTSLQVFIANHGDVAFGFDPDCHFYNSGISFQATTTHTPEPTTALLVGVGLALAWPALRRRDRPKGM
jgi:hypothetical protein